MTVLRPILALLASLAMAAPAAAVCPGDCSGDGTVSVAELLTGVTIALGSASLEACPSFDRDGDGRVDVAELLAAVNALLDGCADEASPTPTPSAANRPPITATPFVYRGFAAHPIALPLGVEDPEGGAVQCHADGLAAGMTLDADNVLRWTPNDDQLGPRQVAFACTDDATPPAAVDGALTLHVAAADACAMPSCDPALGCTATLPPPDEACCGGRAAPRVAEVTPDCPLGAVLEIGRNTDGFGPLRNCDRIRIRNFQQSGAELSIHVRISCLNTLNRITVTAQLDTVPRGKAVDGPPMGVFFPVVPTDGYYERRNIRFAILGGGPYFDLDDAEGNLTVTATDSTGASVSRTVRVRMGFTQPADLPE
ncbi:MAG: hypothetical protein SF182_24380 [Deltaproteobacteria bacterium]|nr:hypothetical protein [Deltaproteobacteria bacterium]